MTNWVPLEFGNLATIATKKSPVPGSKSPPRSAFKRLSPGEASLSKRTTGRELISSVWYEGSAPAWVWVSVLELPEESTQESKSSPSLTPVIASALYQPAKVPEDRLEGVQRAIRRP